MSNVDKNYDGADGVFPVRNDDEHAIIMGKFLPTGRHLVAKIMSDKNLFKLLRGFSLTYKRVEEKINEHINGRLLDESTTYINPWEKTLGVPDDCYTELGSIENRQRYALAKLAADGAVYAEDLERICSILGLTVTVIPGHYFWTNPDPRVSFATEKESRFTIVFEIDSQNSILSNNVFTYTFPITFTENFLLTTQCLIESIIDSNVNAKWIYKVYEIWENRPNGTPITENRPNGTPIVENS